MLRSQNRVITPDPEPEKGFFYRSDHISLAKVGVPMLYPDGGFDSARRRHGRGSRGEEPLSRELLYHQPTDEFDPSWNMSGPFDDAIVLFAFGERLANGEMWPNWRDGNEFRRIRDLSRSAKLGFLTTDQIVPAARKFVRETNVPARRFPPMLDHCIGLAIFSF